MKPFDNDLATVKQLLGYLFGDKLQDTWYEKTTVYECEDLYDMKDRHFGFNRSCMDYFGINRWDDSTAGKAYLDYSIGYKPANSYRDGEYYFDLQYRMDI
jgi:hypothetical protein